MDGHLSSLAVASEIKRLTQRYSRSGPLHPSLFSLSPSGVCHASDVTTGAVGSYIKSILIPRYLTRNMTPPFHPYPTYFAGRYIFCCTFLPVTGTPRYGALYPVELGLSSRSFSMKRSWNRRPPCLLYIFLQIFTAVIQI